MEDKILSILREINPKVTADSELINSQLIDSFEIVNIVMELEEAFGIEIDPDDIVAHNFATPQTIEAMIEKYLSSRI